MNVEIYNCALGNQQGYIYFSNRFNDEVNKVSISSENNLKVSIALLDDIAKELDSVTLLKLDVEGYEKFVIEGARETLEKVKCIYFEVSENNFHNFGYKTEDVLTAIQQSGFGLFKRKDGKKEIVSIDSKYIPVSTVYENLIGIKDIEDFKNRTQWQVSFK
jgi:hypothetical protein